MKIALSRLNNSILGSLAEQTISSSKKPEFTVVTNHPLLEDLESEYSLYTSIFGKQAFSGMGVSVEKSDMIRDAAFSGLKVILQGYIKVPDFEFEQEAIDLFTIFEQRGLDIYNFSYADQSNEMDTLINDLEKPENLVKLDHLNLTPLFTKMKTAESDFKTIYSKQLGANKELRLVKSASSCRRNLEDALHNYYGVVEGMRNKAGWNPLYTELNELVKAIRNSKMTAKQVVTTPTAAS